MPRKSTSRTAGHRLRLLVTAGPTREYLDSVRFISNPSSGKMGYAIAAAAARRGHSVVLISGPVSLPPPAGVLTQNVETSIEMYAAALAAFERCDAAVFCAAVCDYKPVRRARRKLAKKTSVWELELEPTIDIAATLGKMKGPRLTVAFALEDESGRAKAERKLEGKHADAIVLNGPASLSADQTEVEFLAAGSKWEAWAAGSKADIAARLIRKIEELSEPTSGT